MYKSATQRKLYSSNLVWLKKKQLTILPLYSITLQQNLNARQNLTCSDIISLPYPY